VKRNEFLKLIGRSSTGLLLGSGFGNLNDLHFALKEVVIYDNYVNGVGFRIEDFKKCQAQKDEPVELKREDNLYDSFAIQVIIRNYFVGYIPAYENIVLANLLDAGATLTAQVSKVQHIDEESDPYCQKVLAVKIKTKLMLPVNHLTIEADRRADEACDIYRYGPYHKNFDER
jgi:hypothetical protein